MATNTKFVVVAPDNISSITAIFALENNVVNMTRQEFSTILAEYRKEYGPTIKEVCIHSGCLPSDMYRKEKSKHNYNMQKCLDYIKAIGACLELHSGTGERKIITGYNQLVKCVVDERTQSNYTQRSLAKAIGCSYVTLGLFESHKTILTIDTLLKIGEALGFELNVKQNE